MKRLAALFLLFVLPCLGQDLAAMKEHVRKVAEQNKIELKLDLSYADNANPKQRVDLYLPKKRNTDRALPVVAFIHGGGWVNGDRLGYAAAAVQMARTGDYAAVAVGYRFTKEARWPAQIYDCKAAIRWIRGHAAEYHLDAERIAVWGSSAGGHLCSLLGTSGDVKELEGTLGKFTGLSSRVSCVVNQCGPEDFTKALMFDQAGLPVKEDDAVKGLLGGTFEDKHAEALAASPVTYVSADDPPFLTEHGAADQRVAFLHAEAIHKALRKAGVISYLVPITGGAHGSVSHPEAKKRGEAFVAKYLRGVEVEMDVTPLVALPADDKKAR